MTQEEIKIELEELAVRFSEGWHEGIKIDASDIMLLNMAAQALAQTQEPVVCRPRLERVKGNDFEEWRKNISPELYAAGDAVLCWVNEGDLCMPPPQRTKQNFCPRCGKRTADLTTIHTCTPPQENTWIGSGDLKDSNAYLTPPQRTWVGLTAEEKKNIFLKWYGKLYTYTKQVQAVMDSVEAKLKEKNT